MNAKRLIAAIGEVRAKLALVEHLLESGDDEKALEVLGEAGDAWSSAMRGLRS